jgi:acyl-CoA synthetase (AMP-forming)/AMP-acid ligase II
MPDEPEEMVRSGRAAAPWTTIGAVVERQACARGDRVAVIFPDMAQLSYAELESMSRAIGQGMLARGVRRGDRVASMLRNSPAQLLIWLAAARIGAVAVPANISLAVSDLAHVIGECQPGWLVTEPKYQETVRAAAALAGAPDAARVAVVDPAAVAGPGGAVPRHRRAAARDGAERSGHRPVHRRDDGAAQGGAQGAHGL